MEIMTQFNRSALIIGIIAILSFGLGFWARGDESVGTFTIEAPVGNVRVIEVPVPVITEKIVKQFVPVPDKTIAAAVLAENKALKVKVDELSVSLAKATSTGSGPVTTEVISADVASNTPANHRTTFKDWRLSFESDGQNANYTLTQQYSIVNTVGKNKDGISTQLVRLFEIGPGDVRTPIPTISTLTIVADKELPHFYVKLTVQGGAGRVFNSSTLKQETAGIVAIPWLKRGRTKATEDTSFAFLSPAVAFVGNNPTFGVLPLSYNLGSLPKQPFTNVWVSPFVGTKTGATVDKIGIVGTFTF